MAEIKLFHLNDTNQATAIQESCTKLEKDLQNIVEKNMETFFGVRFLASEYLVENYRIDSIGIDENNTPVIFEYKRNESENIINQGLCYLNCLKKHKDAFKLLVFEKLGKDVANDIDWTMPYIICIANDFKKYDEQAIHEMTSSVSLIRYKRYDTLFLFELVAHNVNAIFKKKNKVFSAESNAMCESNTIQESITEVAKRYQLAPKTLQDIFDTLKEYAVSLGDDVIEAELKYYLAFKKSRNFATMTIAPKKVTMHFQLNPAEFSLTDKLRDVTNLGHLGCGRLEFALDTYEDVAFAKELLEKAYNEN